MRVIHLVGSPVSSFYADLSALYARGCLEATAGDGREHQVAYVAPGGRWCFPRDLSPASIEAAPTLTVAEAVARLISLRPDVGVPQLFCRPGMTSYRALFDVLRIPFVGNRPDVMAIGADKVRAKALVAAAGVAVPVGEVLHAGEQPTVSLPAVVKPVDADNSLGVSLVQDEESWPEALRGALAHGDRALVEPYIELGREVRCGVIERDGALVCLPLEEYAVDPVGRPVRTFDDKLGPDAGGALALRAKGASSAWLVPADDPVTEPVGEAARRCHQALGCRHHSLFDFRIDPDGRPWFLEASLYCSFSPKSVITMMAAEAGITLPDLFAEQLAAATADARR